MIAAAPFAALPHCALLPSHQFGDSRSLMSFSLSPPLYERMSALAQRRGQPVERLLADLLAQAEAGDADFFERSIEMLYIANTEGRFLRLNHAFCVALGYTEIELLAEPFLALIHPDDAASTLDALDALRQGQPAAQFVSRCRCADGTYKCLSWTSTALPDGRIYGGVRDITRQRQLEDSLKAQASAAHAILESISDGFFALDSQWRFTYVNAEAESLLRFSADTLLGSSMWDKFPAAIDTEFFEQYHRVVATGAPARFNAYFAPFNTWFEVHAYPADGGVSVYFRDITQLKKDEATLRWRAQEFRMLVENNPDAIGRLNRDLRLIYLNPALRHQLRLGADAPADIALHDLRLPPQTLSYLTEEARRVFAGGAEQWVRFEVPLRHQRRYLEARIAPEYAPDGSVETLLTITRDITSRRRTEQALYESEAFFRAIVESQIDMVCRYSPDTTLVYANDAYCRFFGRSREELLGTSYLPLAAPETREAIRERVAEVVRDPRPAVRVFPTNIADGTKRYIQWVDQGIVNQRGEVVLIQAVGRDITRLKETEAALAQKEEQYRLLFENNPVPMWVYEPATLRFLAVNEAAVAQYGYSRDEFFRLRVTDLSIPEDRTRLARIISQLKPERSVPVEWRQMRKDGTLMSMEVFGHAVVFEGRPARIALARDVTQRYQLEEQRLYTQTLELELAKQRELTELRERFMSMVSHEFRTPLAIVSSSVDIIQHYFDRISREKIDERLADISFQVFSMASLLEDVMSILRGNAGRLPFNPEEVDLVSLCAHAIEHIRLTDRGQHQIALETKVSELYIQADYRLLQHVVTNLIANAVKYSPPGTHVHVTVCAVEGGIEFVVQDEGIGIPEADQPYLFQPFHRGHNTASIAGTGLGLSIVKQNVELHGGEIHFRSVENQGTTFTVQIPHTAPAPAQGRN